MVPTAETIIFFFKQYVWLIASTIKKALNRKILCHPMKPNKRDNWMLIVGRIARWVTHGAWKINTYVYLLVSTYVCINVYRYINKVNSYNCINLPNCNCNKLKSKIAAVKCKSEWQHNNNNKQIIKVKGKQNYWTAIIAAKINTHIRMCVCIYILVCRCIFYMCQYLIEND